MLHEMQGVDIIAVDCEGVKLGKPGGRLCLVQMSCRKASAAQKVPLSIYLVDIVALGSKAFSTVYVPPTQLAATSSSSGSSSSSTIHAGPSSSSSAPVTDSTVANSSIKAIFEGRAVTKYLFDVRGDSEALSSEFRVKVFAAYDLQLAEVALRQSVGEKAEHVMGLDKCLARYCTRTHAMTEDLMASHYVSKKYHVTNLTQVWAQRPLTAELVRYAASDVRYMHALADALNRGLSKDIIEKVCRNSRLLRLLQLILDCVPAPGVHFNKCGAPLQVKKHTVTRITVKDHSGTTPRSQAPEIVNTSRGRPPAAAREASAKAATNSADSRFPWLFAALLIHHDEAQHPRDSAAPQAAPEANNPTHSSPTSHSHSRSSSSSTPAIAMSTGSRAYGPSNTLTLSPRPSNTPSPGGDGPRAPELMGDATMDLLMVYYLQRAGELPLGTGSGGEAAEALAWLGQASALLRAFHSSAGVPPAAPVKANSITSSQLVRPPPRRI
ncbi:MAG: hypothetical protein WDW36_004594 [Sanguina aurantia]